MSRIPPSVLAASGAPFDQRLTVQAPPNSGHSADTARQTLDTLSEKGLAQQEPGARGVIVTTH